jgi:hypothetical protein
MSVVNQIMSNIKEELTNPKPSTKRIITILSDLRSKEEYQLITDSEFYDIVGETFKLNPKFFMKNIYSEMLSSIHDQIVRYSRRYKTTPRKINMMEMEKYIIEKFCLYQGEQILYECDGQIKEINPTPLKFAFNRDPIGASVDRRIYITNYRIIAHGKLSVWGGQRWGWGIWSEIAAMVATGGSKRCESRLGIIGGSLSQELPCYGYQFKTTNHVRLKKKSNGVGYWVIVNKVESISNPSGMEQKNALINAMRKVRLTLHSSKKEDINNLYKALCKNVYQTINSFYEIHEVGLHEKFKRKEFLYRLRELWDSEEYQHLSNSEYLEIVEAVYNLDPQFFMTIIYPKMMSWTFPSFLNVKSEISEILNK